MPESAGGFFMRIVHHVRDDRSICHAGMSNNCNVVMATAPHRHKEIQSDIAGGLNCPLRLRELDETVLEEVLRVVTVMTMALAEQVHIHLPSDWRLIDKLIWSISSIPSSVRRAKALRIVTLAYIFVVVVYSFHEYIIFLTNHHSLFEYNLLIYVLVTVDICSVIRGSGECLLTRVAHAAFSQILLVKVRWHVGNWCFGVVSCCVAVPSF